ncbi:histone-lysine N-methyltransferase MECOM-like [Diprion similis]|uniref:histone-lysine N-methyltransferase MECOM-like n=1 Tax=Diprion similis TaxID=362088 RepID=UPI001EF7FE57|nr:histone-lysine N-methyltransferase MECOM-like [Diprion similis]
MFTDHILDFSGHYMYSVMAQNNLIKSIESLRNTISHRFPRSSVTATTSLPQDASTEIIEINRLKPRDNLPVQNVEVAFVDGRVRLAREQENLNSSWLRMVALANDCQSCNVLLAPVEKGVVVRTIRHIAPGEELLLWFTEKVLAMMNIPFLTPANIQGQNSYVCHRCSILFEYPNPLKVHMALQCDTLDQAYLWTLLTEEFEKVQTPSLSTNTMPSVMTIFQFKLTDPQEKSVQQISPILSDTFHGSSPSHSPSSSVATSPVVEHLSLGHSAFKPYLQPAVQDNVAVPIYTPEIRSCRPTMVQSVYPVPQTHLAPELHAAQMETIVSNLGKSKQGHLCIYCGKVYSRKYGLKIHIRTHTGYKPLKCKYCLRPFGDPSNLNKHVRLHAEGDTPYKCELCGKVLVRRRDLERHIRSRHQDAAEHFELSDASSDSMDVE